MTLRIEAVPDAAAPRPDDEAPPCAFVVFGATGDLTRRKLVPALYHLAASGALPDRFATVGVARRPWDDDTLRAEMRAGVIEHGRSGGVEGAVWDGFARGLHYVAGSFDDPATYEALERRLDALDRERGLDGHRLYYLATPPSEFATILHRLAAAGLVSRPDEPSWTRVIVEKPFGRDLATARALDQLIARHLDESQTFRIDHYLGKETVQNLMVFRFANSLFEPLWSRNHIDHVQITAAETDGVGSRGSFYEENGVVRDVVQNHLLQVLSLVAMEPPIRGSAEEIRGEKLKIVHALRPLDSGTIARDVVTGQYRGYRAEPEVAADSAVATFVAMRVFVDNWRWEGVPFYLRAGKRLERRVTEVSLHFRAVPLSLFGDAEDSRPQPNVLTMRIQPDEGICLRFASKVPGHDFAVGSVSMDMSYREAFGGEPPEAYERLLLDAMRGDATLFSRRDAVEASWQWLAPLLDRLDGAAPDDTPLYAPGSWGPPEADRLIARDGRAWTLVAGG